MKNISKLLILPVAALAFAGCIKETFPMGSTATATQVGESPVALEASVLGIPSQLTAYYPIYGYQNTEIDMSYPALMIEYTELMGDIFPQGSNIGYDWFHRFNDANSAMSETSYQAFVPWRTLYMYVKTANDIAGPLEAAGELNDTQKHYLGIAYTLRAWTYWQLWGLLIPVENQYTDVSNVLGLTVPIVTNNTAESEGGNNPRAKEEDLVKFILEDLDKAEELLADYNLDDHNLPDLSVVYGVKARVYLFGKDYENAAKYARMAIDNFKGKPTTEAEWLDVNTGFNTPTAGWMWYAKYDSENMGNLCNFTGWMSGEADWGYNSLNHYGINRWLYDRLSNTDFRKFSFIDPNTSFYPYKFAPGYLADYPLSSIPTYTSYKFRCVGGDWENYATGGASSIPIMRIEEMYLIEAEAVGMSKGEADGIKLLEDFVTNYRDPYYSYAAAKPCPYDFGTVATKFQEEVLFHKRIELWGEGPAFFDAKRLQVGSYQWYKGSNASADVLKINAKGIKPQWTPCIPQSEVDNNAALQGFNNPDPTAIIKPDQTVFE